jgi:hypothetical protein
MSENKAFFPCELKRSVLQAFPKEVGIQNPEKEPNLGVFFLFRSMSHHTWKTGSLQMIVKRQFSVFAAIFFPAACRTKKKGFTILITSRDLGFFLQLTTL